MMAEVSTFQKYCFKDLTCILLAGLLCAHRMGVSGVWVVGHAMLGCSMALGSCSPLRFIQYRAFWLLLNSNLIQYLKTMCISLRKYFWVLQRYVFPYISPFLTSNHSRSGLKSSGITFRNSRALANEIYTVIYTLGLKKLAELLYHVMYFCHHIVT